VVSVKPEEGNGNHCATSQLRDDSESNRDGIGARIRLVGRIGANQFVTVSIFIFF
jgi:hypothetical protein